MARLATLRAILREIRHHQPDRSLPLTGNALSSHIFSLYRRHQVTDKLHCKAAEEMQHLAESYATYLTHSRLWKEVHQEFHAQSERSVKETADLVGFKLPHDPK